MKNKLKIITRILFLTILKNINTEIFLFSFSLSITLIFGHLVGNFVLLTLFSHFILWFLFNERFIKKLEMEEDNEEISNIIKSLKEKIKQ
jgi:hypothetical protein